MTQTAILALANGTIFSGKSIGVSGTTVGEVVFNTSLYGYEEILTDPSYCEQLIALTASHIGNIGCNTHDKESDKVWAKGLIIRDLSLITSNWRAQESLPSFLEKNRVIAISDIDTRHLTHVLREQGSQKACITTEILDTEQAVEKAREFAGLEGLDLAKTVTTDKIYSFAESASNTGFHVVVYDYGVKHSILRLLAERACRVTVVPAKTSSAAVLALNPDGIVLSNGPGDPAACTYAISAIREFLERNIPLFGICLGFQLLALACGARSSKMKFGHHGANHPVRNEQTGTVAITSQNHGFTIADTEFPEQLEITHRSLFDNSLQGIKHKEKPAFGFQGHPEANPGPHDIAVLFDQFISMMQNTPRL